MAEYNPICSVSLAGLQAVKESGASSSAAGKGVYWATSASDELPIKLGASGIAALPPTTVMQAFQQVVSRLPEHPALMNKENGVWRSRTWQQYYDETAEFAKSCISIGLQRFEGVGILGSNAPEWLIANAGAIFAGAIPAGIYTTNGPDACHYILEHCDAAIAVVDDESQLAKLLEVRHRLPRLKAIVVWQWRDGSKDGNGVYSWGSFIRLGDRISDDELQQRIGVQLPGHCATLIYTSGTTGLPKGVMLSHDNLTWTPRSAQQMLVTDANDHLVSYLPLSHIAAQMTDIHGPMAIGNTVWFAEPDALKGSLAETLREVRPTRFMAVPRVWEKIEEKLREVGAANTGIKKRIGEWAKDLGFRTQRSRMQGNSDVPWGYSVANAIVFSNVKKAIGLDRCKTMASGAAPISKQTLHYFMSLDIPIYELYGMSECSGPQTLSNEQFWRTGSCGVSIPGTDLWLDSSHHTDAEGKEGEICFRGRHIFMGYLKNDDATASTIDANGFLHSGDIGHVDSQGYLYITGRIKELIITAGGENVPPVLIESMIKEQLPAVSNCVVIGDKRKYLTCLLTLRAEVDPNTGVSLEPLLDAAIRAAEEAGSTAKTVSEAKRCPKFLQMIQDGIDRYNNENAISRAQHIRRWAILDKDLSIAGGELTPTMKVRRKQVDAIHARAIQELYPEDTIPARL